MRNERQSAVLSAIKTAEETSVTISRMPRVKSERRLNRRRKGLDAVKELLHFPRSKRHSRARTHSQYKKIGIITPFFTQSSFTERLRGIADVFAAENYELVLYSVTAADDLENYIRTLTASKRVDALIVLSLNLGEQSLTLLRSASFPVCFVENEVAGFDSVAVQNVQGGHNAARHLFNAGVHCPGFVGERSSLPYAVAATQERLRGFTFFFANQGILIPENHIFISEGGDEALNEGIRAFLSQERLPDGVFCASDAVAARFIHCAHEQGIYIPDDIKLVGFDNIDIAKYLELSSVSQNLDESGRLAANMVLSRLQDAQRGSYTAHIPLAVIERGSTARRF